jgi:threonyl-tRNA synthetase
MWASSEAKLLSVLDRLGLRYKKAVGEAAFYGPKLDVQQKNVMGKEETIFTIQIDFVLPERFDMKYVGEDGKEHRPVAIHRSSIGCLERTMAFLIEHYAGMFPTWLAPVQIIVMSITDESIPYAKGLIDSLRKAGLRVEADLRNEKIGKKVREARLQRIPYLVTVGQKEAETNEVSVRNRDTQAQAIIPFDAFLKNVVAENQTYALKLNAEQIG